MNNRCLLTSLLCASTLTTARLVAADSELLRPFPGVEGFNTQLCTHGRGGRVVVVNSLADSKNGKPVEGTFRWACALPEPRIIVFAVGGIIPLEKEVTVAPDVYIAGQTAPGDGICLTQAGLKLGSNTLIRHVRFRMGDKMPGAALTKRDAFESHGNNIIIDHCSIAWTTDEAFRINGGENVTISHCFLGEGLHITKRAEMHNYGPALEPNFETGGMTKNLAIHHCLFSGYAARSPLIGNGDREVHLVFANNVIYNYGGMKYPPMHTYAPKKAGPKAGAAFGKVDVIANYFKEGPVTPADSPVALVHGDLPNGGIHFSGNLASTHRTAAADEWKVLLANADDAAVQARTAREPQNTNPGVTLTDAATALNQVLEKSGASMPKRDAVDTRFAAEVRSGDAFRGTSGGEEGGEFRAYRDHIFEDPAAILEYHVKGQHKSLGMKLDDIDPVPGGKEYFATFPTATAPKDTDADGIPDEWENTHGLNPNDAKDNTKPMPSGYTAIEDYVNGLAL